MKKVYIPIIHYARAPDFEMSLRIILGRGIFDRRSFNQFIKRSPSHDVVVEVGSHVGSWTIGLSQVFNTVVGFEPQPTNYKYLVKNLERANVKNATIFNKAVANDIEKKYSITEISQTRNSGMSHLIPLDVSNDNTRSLSCIRLDDAVEKSLDKNQSLSALKIDVEGFELEVLKSGQKAIEKYKPLILLEINRHMKKFGVKRQDVYTFMKDMNYKEVKSIRNDHLFLPEGP